MMRRGAGLHAHDTGREPLKERQNMPALQLTADDHLSRRIDAVDLKHRLGDVETDCRDRLHAWLPITATAPAAITQWHLRAGGGAVHSIRSGRSSRPDPDMIHHHSGSPAFRRPSSMWSRSA